MTSSNIIKLVIAVVFLTVLGLFISGNIQIGSPNSKQNPDIYNSTQDKTFPSYQTLEVGQKAPDFTVTTVDGNILRLNDFQGKILVVTSGAAWCPTCIIENKNFNPVQGEVKNKGVEFMTVDIDPIDDETAIKEFQKRYAPWHNVAQLNAKKMIQDYGFWRFEITYIIDRKGIVQFKDSDITSTETLREELAKLL